MAREIEIKIAIPDAQTLRDRLRTAGATFVASRFEVNRMFDATDRGLFRAGCGLRIRQETIDGRPDQHVLLTYKGPTDISAVKSREEIETDVADPVALAAILSRLGFAEVIRFEKRRELWQLAGCEIALDELPKLGCFVEIEGPDEAAIRNAQAAVGLSNAAAACETYPAMAARDGIAQPDGSLALEFPAGGGPALA